MPLIFVSHRLHMSSGAFASFFQDVQGFHPYNWVMMMIMMMMQLDTHQSIYGQVHHRFFAYHFLVNTASLGMASSRYDVYIYLYIALLIDESTNSHSVHSHLMDGSCPSSSGSFWVDIP